MDEGGPRQARHAYQEAKARDPKITLRMVAGFLREHRKTRMLGGAQGTGDVENGPKRPRGRPAKPKPEYSEEERERRLGIIEDAFTKYSNFGHVGKTYEDVRKIDPTITREEVRRFKIAHEHPMKELRGKNSYVAKAPYEEYQLDLMFFEDLRERVPTEGYRKGKKAEVPYEAGLLCVDIFTKWCHVEPITTKETGPVLKGLKECFRHMNDGRRTEKGKVPAPKMVYHDAESAFVSQEVQNWFRGIHVKSITTLGHAPVAERTIRTIKALLYPRIREKQDPKWWEEMPEVLKVYNRVDAHRSTGVTPLQALDAKNQDDVRLNLELNRKTGRKYEEINPGDLVRIYKKKDKPKDKENVSPWSKETYKVTEAKSRKKGHRGEGVGIINVQTTKDKPLPKGKTYLMRHEVLKVGEY